MGKIAKMSTKLANMIAAGEVVEKPSSVVKELVENAIDAKSKNITVILKDGGLTEIKIIDDGEGMDEEDVALAFLPHATSKIKNEYDLFRILSLGFRGEAIASIAAVSNMQIISSTTGINGYQVTYEAGVKKNEGIISSNKGTTVTVKNLFFNTPVRLKYLKPAKNELASISYFMDRIALAHPDIRFKLINDDKNYLLTTASNNYQTLMGEIYGINIAKNILENQFEIDGVVGKLVLVKPEIYRSNKLEITLIVNGRFVKSYNVTNAIIEGYSTYLPIGKYPISVLYLNIDPMLCDVNVHPSKTEIKISNEESIVEKLTEVVKSTLESIKLIPTREIPVNSNFKNNGYIKNNIFELPKLSFEEDKNTVYLEQKNDIFQEDKKEKVQKFEEIVENINVDTQIEEKIKEDTIENHNSKLPYFEYIGQAFGTYLIFQNNEGLYLIDQHAAAERINYEKYYEILGRKNQPTTELLIPIMITLTKSEILFVESNISTFESIGFSLEPISDNDYVIRRIPLWAKLDDVEDVVLKTINLILESRKIEVIAFRDTIAKQISCKASIKANKTISKIEIDALISNLNKCKNPYTCPHGRPTMIKFSTMELEKMFERIQS